MTRPIHIPKPWAGGRARSMGGPFDELYRERAPLREPKPKKRSTNLSRKGKVLRDLENVAPAFNIAIGSQADSMRTAAIKGKL